MSSSRADRNGRAGPVRRRRQVSPVRHPIQAARRCKRTPGRPSARRDRRSAGSGYIEPGRRVNIRILILSWTLKMVRPSRASSPRHIVSAAEPGPLRRFDDQTRPDELLDLGLDVEHPMDRRGKPRGRFRLRSQQAGKAELCGVRHSVQLLVRARADPDRRAEIGDEAVGVRPVVLRNRAGIRPGPKEQLNEAVVEQIEKPRERVVPGEYVVIGFFSGRQWQGALRPEQAEVSDENFQRRVVVLLRPAQRWRREIP